MSKSEQMAELGIVGEEIHARACSVGSTLVWGEGDLDAELMIVGEAPGADEDRIGRPFVGPSGKFLYEELRTAKIDLNRVYITSVVKCRPIRPGTRANRTPTREEIEAWRSLTLDQIRIIAPRLILCLGSIAASVVIHPRFAMATERGTWFDGPNHSRAIATYHPAYVRRFGRASCSEALPEFRADLRDAAQALST